MSDKLYFDYIKEREGYESVFIEGKAFATFIIQGEEIYVRDVYVAEEFRKQGVLKSLYDLVSNIAIERDCKYMTGTVCPSMNGSTLGINALLAIGFELLESRNNVIILKKEL